MDTLCSSLSEPCLMGIDLFDITVQVNDQLEVSPVNVFTLHMSRPSSTGDFGEWASDVD